MPPFNPENPVFLYLRQRIKAVKVPKLAATADAEPAPLRYQYFGGDPDDAARQMREAAAALIAQVPPGMFIKTGGTPFDPDRQSQLRQRNVRQEWWSEEHTCRCAGTSSKRAAQPLADVSNKPKESKAAPNPLNPLKAGPLKVGCQAKIILRQYFSGAATLTYRPEHNGHDPCSHHDAMLTQVPHDISRLWDEELLAYARTGVYTYAQIEEQYNCWTRAEVQETDEYIEAPRVYFLGGNRLKARWERAKARDVNNKPKQDLTEQLHDHTEDMHPSAFARARPVKPPAGFRPPLVEVSNVAAAYFNRQSDGPLKPTPAPTAVLPTPVVAAPIFSIGDYIHHPVLLPPITTSSALAPAPAFSPPAPPPPTKPARDTWLENLPIRWDVTADFEETAVSKRKYWQSVEVIDKQKARCGLHPSRTLRHVSMPQPKVAVVKVKKASKAPKQGDGVNRLEKLPDNVLLSIMSLGLTIEDLLRVVVTSKFLRRLLMRRAALHAWRCAFDLRGFTMKHDWPFTSAWSPQQWAHYLVTKECSMCGGKAGKRCSVSDQDGRKCWNCRRYWFQEISYEEYYRRWKTELFDDIEGMLIWMQYTEEQAEDARRAAELAERLALDGPLSSFPLPQIPPSLYLPWI